MTMVKAERRMKKEDFKAMVEHGVDMIQEVEQDIQDLRSQIREKQWRKREIEAGLIDNIVRAGQYRFLKIDKVALRRFLME